MKNSTSSVTLSPLEIEKLQTSPMVSISKSLKVSRTAVEKALKEGTGSKRNTKTYQAITQKASAFLKVIEG